MSSYRYVLLDLDNTLYDTRRTERLAMQELNLLYARDRNEPELFELYHKINALKWKLLESGALKVSEINHQRFQDFFNEAAIEGDFRQAASEYLELLAKHHLFLPGAEEIYRYLAEKYQVALITNGLKEAQMMRLRDSFIDCSITPLFIGEDMGRHKPDPEVVSIIESELGWQSRDAMILIGDSLQSDINCAMKAGIDSIWCNFTSEDTGDFLPSYMVTSLDEITDIL